MTRSKMFLVLCASFLLLAPALAEDEAASGLPGSTASPWGIRLGLATDPDQLVVGANFLEFEITDNLWLEPNAELGFGDDVTMLTGTAPVHYRFVVDAKVRPYAGGGVTLGWARVDKHGETETEFDISLRATGGILWSLKGGNEMFAELNLIFGDLHDVQAMVGWRF